MSLSNDTVLTRLRNQFVCGYRNITGEPYAGRSGRHETDSPAVITTNGAGPRNVQMFMLSEDGTVLHCLPGFWSSQDLLAEMTFALNLNRVWLDANLTREVKDLRFEQAHIMHLQQHPQAMIARSHLQDFDARHEKSIEDSDFIIREGDMRRNFRLMRNDSLKTTDQVMHERMSKRPFLQYEDFDVQNYASYGKSRYDKNEERRAPTTSTPPSIPRQTAVSR